MYYIEDRIEITEGAFKEVCTFFNLNQLRIDYLNTELEAQIACYRTKQDFKERKPAYKIIPLLIDYGEHDYNLDPNLFAWRLFISAEGSIFYKAEIKKVYDMSGDW